MALDLVALSSNKSTTTVSSGTAHTISVTASAGSRRMLLVGFFCCGSDIGSAAISAATYDGAAGKITAIGVFSAGTGSPTPAVALFRVMEADIGSGSKEIAVTLDTDTGEHGFIVLESVDVDQTSPIGTDGATAHGGGSLQRVDITVACDESNGQVFMGCCHRRDSSTYSIVSGETIETQDVTSNAVDGVTFAMAHEPANSGSLVIALDAAAAQRQNGVAAELIEDLGGGGGGTILPFMMGHNQFNGGGPVL